MKNFLTNMVVIAILAIAAAVQATEINVFAAASLTESLKQIAAAYEKQSQHRVVLNFGSSSTLARQIEAGAPADIFFSADEAKMDGLEKKGLILKETRKSRLSNSLVIVVAAEKDAAIANPEDLASDKVKRVALAEPKSVPAGIYAKEYLQAQKLWPAVEPKVIPTENVRAALAAVEAGNVDAGIVYKTDAAISKKVKVVFEVPVEDGPKISYPVAIMNDAPHLEAAKKFLAYLLGEEAGKVFSGQGFVFPANPVK